MLVYVKLFSGCFVADMMSGEETQKLEFANFEPVLRSLGGNINWFLHEYNTDTLLNLRKHYLDSPEIKVKMG